MFEIGNSLREARLRQGLDFPQVEQATKIRGKWLRALEEEQFDVLPAQTYVKGFLRTYAEYLGLDGQLYVDEFNSRHVVGEDDPALRARRSARVRQRRGVESRVVVLALLGIVAVTALVIVAWRYGGSNNKPTLPAVPNTAPRHQRTPTLALTAVRGSSHLTVRQGSALGRVLWSGTLTRGETQTFGESRLWIDVGRSQAVRIRVAGKTLRAHHGHLIGIVTHSGLRTTA
jgi:cytoskeletal protein RodZ